MGYGRSDATRDLPPFTLQDVGEMLAVLDPGMPREEWARIGMAIKAEFGEDGFDAWNAWSEGGASYTLRAARETWRSISGHGGVGFGTLVHLAMEAGWKPQALELTPEQLAEREAAAAARRAKAAAAAELDEAERVEWQERIATFSAEVWELLARTSRRAPYLGKKQVGAHGVRFARHGLVLVTDLQAKETLIISGKPNIEAWFQSEKRNDRERYSYRYLKAGTVVVPVQDAAGKLWGLQLIFESGGKSFFRHGRKRGCFHLIGEINRRQPLAFAEGYATAASVHEATGWPVVVTFDAGNLRTVACELRELHPDLTFVFCGDDDHENVNAAGEPENPGRQAAAHAAGQARGITAFPVFAEPAKKKDWNDLHVHEGIAVVREQLEAALAAAPAVSSPAAEPDAGSKSPSKPTSSQHLRSAGGGDEPPGNDGWRLELSYSKNGNLKPDLFNLMTILDNDPEWAGMFRMDGFGNQIWRTRATCYGAEPGEISDVDGTEIAAWLGNPRHYGVSVSSERVLEAVEALAMRRCFHPVLEYLDGVTWDGTERLQHMLSDFFGAEYNKYTAAVSKNWLVSAVARVRNPGCKVDEMVILEGGQGMGKSTAVRILCGDAWFAEMLESPQNKDFYQILQGRWIIEIPELQAFNKADRNKIKAAVSAQDDTYRPSYGRFPRKFLRQCIFVGTTNDDAYLKDETGGRRFMPVRCQEINQEGLRAMRDQLWAEADALFKQGHEYWRFPAQAAVEQDARYDADAWEDPVADWLGGHRNYQDYPDHYPLVSAEKPPPDVTVSEVMEFALGIPIAKQTRPDQMRVGAILRRLGWQRGGQSTRPGGHRPHVYRRE